jgi:hypothetical protein
MVEIMKYVLVKYKKVLAEGLIDEGAETEEVEYFPLARG